MEPGEGSAVSTSYRLMFLLFICSSFIDQKNQVGWVIYLGFHEILLLSNLGSPLQINSIFMFSFTKKKKQITSLYFGSTIFLIRASYSGQCCSPLESLQEGRRNSPSPFSREPLSNVRCEWVSSPHLYRRLLITTSAYYWECY